MQNLILKIATASLLILAALTGTISAQHAEPTPAIESAVLGTTLSALPSSAESSHVSATDEIADANQTLNTPVSIDISPVNLIAAGACAAIIGCCVLGFALLRFRLRGRPRSSWITAVRRISSVVIPLAPLTSPSRPSLTLLSISRT